jgi:hypothetical protein
VHMVFAMNALIVTFRQILERELALLQAMRKLLCAMLALRSQNLRHYTSNLVVGFEVTSTSDTTMAD